MSGDSWFRASVRRAACAAASSLVLVSIPARAEVAEPAELRYDVPASCPAAADFSALIAARTASWLAPASPLAVSVEVRPTAEGTAFRGTVTLVREGRATARELSTANCEELVQALALIVAILIDPRAATAAATDGASTPAAASVPAERPRPLEPRAVLAPAPHVTVQPQTSSRPPGFMVGPELVLETGVTGAPAFGERVFLGVEPAEARAWFSSARLAVSRVANHAQSPLSGARAEFELGSVRLDGCGASLSAGPFALEHCLFAEVGRLQARGLHPAGAVRRVEAWGTLGGLLRPSLTLARRFVLGAELGVHATVTRYEFAFTGEPPVTRTANYGVTGAFGVGLRFP